MAEPMAAPIPASGTGGRSMLQVIARQRELSLVAIMIVLGGLVALAAPQFLTGSNLSQVAVLASITAIAAIGEALVVITRNIDLSVEATMGLVAYCVAITLESHLLSGPAAIVMGLFIGARPRDGQRPARDGVQGPVDRRDAGHAEHLPRHRLPDRGQPPGPARRPARGLHRPGARRDPRHPDLRRDRHRRGRHRDGGAALDALRAPGLRGRQQPRGGGDPRHPARGASCSPRSPCAGCSPASPA